MSELENISITLALSKQAFGWTTEQFSLNKWVSWNFPDYVIRLELDPTIEEGVVQRHDGRRLEAQQMMSYTFPASYLPDDVTRIVRLGFAEAVRCYENSCFLSSIAMCGRTIETVLGALYEKTVGVHPVDDPQKPGFNAILNRLKKEGFTFPAGLKEKMEVIGLHRNMAVHGNLAFPTEDEARSVIYSTKDVLRATAQ